MTQSEGQTQEPCSELRRLEGWMDTNLPDAYLRDSDFDYVVDWAIQVMTVGILEPMQRVKPGTLAPAGEPVADSHIVGGAVSGMEIDAARRTYTSSTDPRGEAPPDYSDPIRGNG